MKRLLLILATILVAGWLWSHRERSHPPGVVAGDEPVQQPLADTPALEHKGYRIQPLQRFEIEARVLSASTYRIDREAELAPVDLALGWGRMSDSAVLEQLSISQSSRFYFWRAEEFPIPRREIETHSANMHMIPSSPAIGSRLKDVSRGQVVRISGYLVEARSGDGWTWRSSLTRDDTGYGACELIWVEELDVR